MEINQEQKGTAPTDVLPIYQYIIDEEATFKTAKIPVTGSKEWNMHEHIERCTNVSHGWFHSGKDDGNRPYDDIVTPIINVAIRSEGFDVKDIQPYVNEAENYFKSFLVKKYHPQWARKNEIDTFIDDMVESSVIYDLAVIKNVNNARPVVTPLQSIAFCDQTDFLSGPQCLKHQFSPSEMQEFEGKWDADGLEMAITMGKASKTVSQANEREAKTPGKYSTVYELHGSFPNSWLGDKMEEGADPDKYTPQLHIVTYYNDTTGKNTGVTLFKGREPKPVFKTMVLKKVFGRACGQSIVETLFEPQVWTNYSGIRIKELLDAAAIVLFHSDDPDLGNKKLTNLKNNTVVKLNEGKTFGRTDTTAPNIGAFNDQKVRLQQNARTLGSANDAQLGVSPSDGTPFKLQDLVVQEGQGIHEYRQGKISTFMSDQLYRDWILQYLVDEMNQGQKFSEELSLDELTEIAEQITINQIEFKIKRMILATGKVPTEQERDIMRTKFKEDFMRKGNRRFFEILKGELKDIPVDVYVNIAGKQKKMAQNADKLTNLIRAVLVNPQAFQQVPGIGKMFNELLENSGFSPIDFAKITKPVEVAQPTDNSAPVADPSLAKEPLPV